MGFGAANSSITFVIINALINFLATFPGMWLVENIGRKKMLVYGGIGMSISHFGIALFYGLSTTHILQPSLAWGALICVYTYTFCFSSCWGPTPWVYQSEIFPLRIRAKGQASATMANWVWNAIVAKVTPLVLDKIGFYTYLIFGSFCVLMSIFSLFVPETKGKTLEEMDAVFGYKVVDPHPKGAAVVELNTFNVTPAARTSTILPTDSETSLTSSTQPLQNEADATNSTFNNEEDEQE